MALLESVQTKRNHIITVLIHHVPRSNIPVNILRILADSRYESIEYPESDDNLDAFWSNLASLISDSN